MYVPVDVAGRVSECCCLALYVMKVAVSLASVKWYVGMVYGKLDLEINKTVIVASSWCSVLLYLLK
jgi:hypothetical protein